MPDPGTVLANFTPSRKIFSDASGIVNAEIAGIGDANVNPLLDIAEGIDKGITLGAKANAFIESISPRAEETRQLDLEIKRSQASIQQQAGEAAKTKMAADALTKETDLLTIKNTAESARLDSQNKLQQGQLLNQALPALYQVNDPQSVLDVINDPDYATLRVSPEFNKHAAQRALSQLGQTTDPVMQAKLLQTAELAVPKSAEAYLKFMPEQVRKLFADPKELAETELKQAQAKNQLAEAKEREAKVKGLDAVAQRQEALKNKGPYDPIAAALATEGSESTSGQPAPQAPGAPTPTPTSDSSSTQPSSSVATGAGANPAAQQEQSTSTTTLSQPAAPVDPVRQAKVEAADRILITEDQKKAVVDRLVVAGEADTPSREMRQMVLDDIAARNPDFGQEQIASMARLELEGLRLQPDEFKERQKLSSAIPQLEGALQRIDAALQTVDEYTKLHGDPNLGPNEYFGRQKDILLAKVAGGPDEKKLLDAYAELDASGVNAAMQSIAGSGLTGPLTALMSNEQERDVLQSLQTGSNVSLERNKQAREILSAKLHQLKQTLRIVDAHQAAHVSFEDGARAAGRWVAANPVTEVGRINGAPEVVAKKNLPTADDYIFNKLHLEKYVERNKAGRATTPPASQTGTSSSAPSAMVDEVVDLAEKKARGEKISIPHPSDIPDKLEKVSPALLKRMTFRESKFNPNAESKAGAKGLTQLMDRTGKDLWKEFNWDKEGEYDPFIPEKNVLMGVTYMNRMLKTFNYDTRLALAAYNAGPGKLGDVVQAYKNARNGLGSTDFEAVKMWLPKETRDHVKFIMEDDSDPRTAKPSLTTLEYKGAIDSLPTQKSREWAEQNLSPEGTRALHETASIKRVADTKGTILEDVVSALWSATPFAATTAEAQEPEEETGSDDTRTRVLNDDGSVSTEGQSPADAIASKFQGMEGVRVENEDGTPYQTQEQQAAHLQKYPRVYSTIKEFDILADEYLKAQDGPVKKELAKALIEGQTRDNEIGWIGVGDRGERIISGARQYLNSPSGDQRSSLDELNPLRGAETAQAEEVPTQGMLSPGNIDLSNRQQVRNEDGKISTVRSISFQGVDGSEVLIPTVVNGKIVSDKEAISHYRTTGEHLGKFDSVEAANTYAEQLHQRQAKSLEGIQVSPWEKTKSRAAVNTEGMADGMQAFLLGAARELVYGGEDEMAAKYRMAAHGETWDQATENARTIRDANQKKYPWVYFSGQVAGTLINPFDSIIFKGAKSVLSGAKIIKAAPKATKVGQVLSEQTPSLLKSIGKGAAVAAPSAAIQGFNEAEGGIDNRIDRAISSFVLGIGMGGTVGAVGKGISSKFSSGQLSKEQIAVLKDWANMSDADLTANIAKLSSKNPDASFLSEVGLNKVREQISKMAKNPRVMDDVIDIAEGRVSREVEAVKDVLNKITQNVDSEKAAKDLAIVVKGQVSDFYKELLAIGDTVYDKARAAASKNTVMSKGRYARLKKALPAENEKIIMGEQGAVRSGELGSSDQLFDASGKPLTSKVQRYEIGINHSVERPAFVSDGVFKAMDSNLVAGYVEKAQKLLEDLEGGLQANDFQVLTLARGMMRDEAAEMGGTAGKVLRDAEQRLKKEMREEVPELGVAEEAYEVATKTYRENYSKGLKKLESYAIEGGQLDSRKIHKDLMSMGPEEIKAAMKGLDPADREVYKNSVRNFIIDTLEKRGDRQRGAPTREFPNFTKDSMDRKIKVILGDSDGSELISKFQQQERITTVANKLIKEGEAAKNKAVEEGKELSQRVGLNVAGLSTAMLTMAAFGVSKYTVGITALAGHQALKAYIKKAAFKSEEEMAAGIADILYREPDLGLNLLEEVSKHVQKEIPQYYPTWAKIAAGSAQILVAGGDDREPQTTARNQREAETNSQ